jgi:hypothetical protein
MKTPDEIKKGLECCVIGPSAHQPKCGECPYKLVIACSDELLEDTARLVKQLEAERDAAVDDFKLYRERNIKGECGVYACDLCKHGGKYEEWEEIKCPKGCMGIENWEWRGVQKEDGNA